MLAPRRFGSARDGERRFGRRLHEQVIDDALVLIGDITQLARQGVDDVKVAPATVLLRARPAIGVPPRPGT